MRNVQTDLCFGLYANLLKSIGPTVDLENEQENISNDSNNKANKHTEVRLTCILPNWTRILYIFQRWAETASTGTR